MEIKIDTEKDSKDTIRKIIKLLESIVNEDNYYKTNNYDNKQTAREETQNNYETPNEGLFGLFDTNDDEHTSKQETKEEQKQEDTQEEKKEKIDIIPY